ncbi:MAG: CDP-alcohol phosphatidyltransferase family protein [Candidatus Thermoplasmatota archaeon]
MVLDDYRYKVEPLLTKIGSFLITTHPNTMTWLAFIFAVFAGVSFYFTNFYGKFFLLIASLFIFFNAFFDALDGKVARMRKITSIKGDFLDHVLDRYADIFILGGITFSIYCDLRLGLLAILGVLLASYMGTQSQAVGLKRDYKGALGRADRLVLLIIIPIIQYAIESIELNGAKLFSSSRFVFYGYAFTTIEILMIWFAIAGHATAIQRIRNSWRELNKS